jgi:hypothetical protein
MMMSVPLSPDTPGKVGYFSKTILSLKSQSTETESPKFVCRTHARNLKFQDAGCSRLNLQVSSKREAFSLF